MKVSFSKLSLVGAGPGDPDLITVKAIKVLAEADVVLYDALVHPDLLNYAPARAEKIFVGKRQGNHNVIQEKINDLIVEMALGKGHVVRLKGGDPFIFGRGHEEMVYAEKFNIPVQVIPGVSSCTSIPALMGIPLTRRGISESFAVTTATTKSGGLSGEIEKLAKTQATLVILMGLHKLGEISRLFIGLGKGELPAAVIQSGSTTDQRIAISTCAHICEEVQRKSIASPAIIILGEVVKFGHFSPGALLELKEIAV